MMHGWFAMALSPRAPRTTPSSSQIGAIVTRPLSHAILPGITRAALMSLFCGQRHTGRRTRIHH
jgi:hypothetical protein